MTSKDLTKSTTNKPTKTLPNQKERLLLHLNRYQKHIEFNTFCIDTITPIYRISCTNMQYISTLRF